MKTSKRNAYRISFKHDEHGSDSLGCDFATIKAAQREIESIQREPGSVGWADWLRNATLWITDEKGNIYG